VISLFPYKYLHIGGDECPKVRWEKCPDCRKRMKAEGLADGMELQSWFIRRMEKFLVANNRSLVGWDEILEGGLAPEATVMSWRGVAGGIEAAKQGHDVIMSPMSHCYFNLYQGDKRFEPTAWGDYLSLEMVYSYDPVPADLNADEARHILGAQANLWTEYIASEKLAEYMVLPRLSALAEVVWTPKNLRDYEKFSHRMVRQYERYDAMQLNYRVSAPETGGNGFVFVDSLVADFHSPIENAEILVTTDGTDPVASGKPVTGPVIVKSTTQIRAVTRMKSGRTSVVVVIPAEKQDMLQGVQLSPSITQGVDYEMYDVSMASVGEMDKLKSSSRGTVETFGLPDPAPAKPFGLTMRGYLKIEKPGVYRFYLKSDDGSTLTIGDRLVVNHDGPHGATELSGETALGKGWHMYELRYFDAGGAKSLAVSWSGPGIDKQVVPAASLASFMTPMMMMQAR
jgi:hexosaminidase